MDSSIRPLKEDFRDHLSVANSTGGRRWLYPRVVKGPLLHWRVAVAWLLLASLIVAPFVRIDGHPLFLFNVLERRFVFFGVSFWPQDFHLVAIGLLTIMVFIALFTAAYGRVWCGWVCPQPIFLEMVFRQVERWIEGDHNARQRLDNAPWHIEKILKKTIKHLLFLALSFLIGNLLLMYIIGQGAVKQIIRDPLEKHLTGLVFMILFTGLFYAVFAWLRELVCIAVCPYGRLQGVLLDRNSLVVAYDFIRGEPRGRKSRKDRSAHAGDCIDCGICVQVCPTGIDIRNGTQLECISCTACIDACTSVMQKIDRPTGLIRYDSSDGIENNRPWQWTVRMKAYTAILVGLIGLLIYLLIARSDVEATVLRAPGQQFQRESGGYVSNLYTLELLNKTNRSMPISVRINRPDASVRFVQPVREVPAGDLVKGVFFMDLPEKTLRENSTPLEVEIWSGTQLINRVKTTFSGPITRSH